ncbi:MAG: VCBS repeat-containing protein [Planctomycetes bacterium]|nr:VCBS repeat-containing protein [Planctomycetota bacterium]
MAFASVLLTGSVHPQSLPGGDDFGRGLLGGVDVDRDGVPDVLALENRWGEPECVWVFSGRTGDMLRKDVGEPPRDSVSPSSARELTWVGDIDGDGVTDYAYGLGEWTSGGIVAFRYGKTGARLWSWPERWQDGSGWMSVAPLGDVDGDGAVDFVFGLPDHGTDGQHLGRCVGISMRSRAALFTIEGRVAEARFGRVRALDDLDADGKREFVVWGDRSGGEQMAAGVFRGTDGTRLGWIESSGLRPNGVQTGFDWDADGVSDLFVGCKGCRRSSGHGEELHVFSGRSRSELAIFDERLPGQDLISLTHFGATSTCLRAPGSEPAVALVVGAHEEPVFGATYLFTPKSDRGSFEGVAQALRCLDVPEEILALESWLHIGGALASAGDLDDDHVDDLLVACTRYCGPQRGIVWAVSGRTGCTLFRWHRRHGVDHPILEPGAGSTRPK